MENVKHRIDLRLTTDPKMAINQLSMLNFKIAKYLEDLYMVGNHKTKVVMSKPIYVGCASLDLSKVTMMEFHHNVIEQHFKNNYTLPYCGTDSCIYTIKHPDSYEWVTEHSKHFDLSGYTRADMQRNGKIRTNRLL